jgi:Myb/SANT-like DNA-binding domain
MEIIIYYFFELLDHRMRAEWCDAAESCLMAAYESRFPRFRDTKTNHSVLWGEISRALEKANFLLTPNQCSTKFKILKVAYSAVVTNQKKTGASPKRCKFYDRFDALFRKDHNFRYTSYHSETLTENRFLGKKLRIISNFFDVD